jgi:phosphinothricin acetyltransferase
MRLIIRPSAEGDIPAITAIYADAVLHGTASFELEPPSEEEMARRRAALVEHNYPYLVAEREGALLGYAYAGPYRTRPAYRFTVEDSVYVARGAHGQGVGRALLSALIAACEARGFRLMIAVIGDKASTGSIRLHESAGFRHAGLLEPVGYKHGRWLASVLMQRILGDGAETPPSARNPSSRPA